MSKNLFIVLFSAIWGLFTIPGVTTSSDSVKLTSVHFDAVETVVAEPEPVVAVNDGEEFVFMSEPEPVVEPMPSAPVAGYSTPEPVVWVPNYTVTVHSDTMVADGLSYNDIYMTRKVIYGHNTANLLGNIRNLGVGSRLTITNYGVTRNYVVSDIVTYAKTSDGNLENNPKLMRRIAYSAMGHSLALLTCAGTPYGNGDASHRLVVYVDEV